VAAAPFDALVVPLRAGVRIVFAAAIVLWAGAWLSSSRTLLAREEHARVALMATIRRHARALAVGGAVAAALTIVAWDRPRLVTVAAVLGALAAWEAVVLTSTRSARLPR
jgi:hypothetical protein